MKQLQVGDYVTRDGTDVHLVTYLTDDGTFGDFKCIREPSEKWTDVGDTESNISRRYTFLSYTDDFV